MKKLLSVILVVTIIFGSIIGTLPIVAQESEMQTMEEQTFESRKTPIMGWSSWNALGSSISEEKLKEQMDLMVSLGLKDAGYVYFNTDDGFQNGRDATTGRLRVNETKFPNGMKVIADYAHSKGLKAGIYTDAGDNNCSWSSNKTLDWGVGVGLYQHENDDLYRYLGDGIYRDTYAQNHPEDPGVECWGFDFIKVDWCGGQNANLSAQTQYTKIGNIINEIEGVYNKDKIYNICMWAYEGPFQLIADSWRIGSDIDMSGKSFDSMMAQVDKMKSLSPLTTPGHVNDPDMLIVGKGLTHEEDKTHFGLWCMFSAPLVMGNNLTTITDETLELLTNKDLIAINQDPACIAASYVGNIGTNVEVWLKPLGSADSDIKAIMLVNRSETTQTITVDFDDYGYKGDVAIRDLFAQSDIGSDTSYTVTLDSHQSSALKLTPTESKPQVSMTSHTTTQGEDIVFTGVDGLDYKLFATEAKSTDKINFKTTGTTTTYNTINSYNGTNQGLSVNGNITINIPKSETEQILKLYLGNSTKDVTITSTLDGKSTVKNIPANSGETVYNLKYFTSGNGELTLTLNGENILANAIELICNNQNTAMAQIGTTVSTNNLTNGGNLDWYWNGIYTRISGISKTTGGNISIKASNSENATNTAFGTYSWNDGDLIESSSSASRSKILYGYGDNEYYEISLPSDDLERTVEIPFALSNADVKAELYVGGEKLFEENIQGTSGQSVKKVFTATYSSTVKAKAKVVLTVTNIYNYSGGIVLDCVMLRATQIPFSHSSIGTNVSDYNYATADSDWIDYTTHTRKDGANLLSDYFANHSSTTTLSQNGISLNNYGDNFEISLPSVSAFTRADIEIEIKDANAGINFYSTGNNSYSRVWDITGGKTAIISVWYEKGADAALGISVKGISSSASAVTLKSIALRTADIIADFPTVSQSENTITATLSAKAKTNKNVHFITELYDKNGALYKDNSTAATLTSSLSEITALLEVPTDFTEGTLKVYMQDSESQLISYVSSFDYPINKTMANVANDNRIGGATANYYVNNRGAILLDVRTAEEYETDHLDGAINILYTDLIDQAKAKLPDKNSIIICYCSAGKRSAQAVHTLTAMGYTNVYNLGNKENYINEISIALEDPTTNILAEYDTINAYSSGISQFDKIEIRYNYGKTADLDNSILYDESSGIVLKNDGDGVVDITAYLVLTESNEIITQAHQSYTLLLPLVKENEVDVFFTEADSYTASGKWGLAYVKPNTSVNGRTIKIAGVTYLKGIGTNANNSGINLNDVSTLSPYLTAAVPKGATTFLAVVGKDQSDGIGLSAKATFHVYFDDVLYTSSPALSGSEYFVFRIEIPEGTQKVGLFCEGKQDSNHAAWGNVGFKLKDSYKIPDTSSIKVLEYFSDLDYTIVSGLKGYVKNDLCADGKSAITIAGNTFQKGVGVNAPTTLQCSIPNGSEKFITTAGITASAPSWAGKVSATFSVYIDNVLIDSQLIAKGEFYTFNIDIPENAETLKLETTAKSADGNHNGWGFAAFTYGSDQKTMLHIGYNNKGTSTAYDNIGITTKRSLQADTEYTLSFTNTSYINKVNSIFIGGIDVKNSIYGNVTKHHTTNESLSGYSPITKTTSGNRSEYTFVLTEEQAIFNYQYVIFYFVCPSGTKFDLYLANLTLYRSDDPNKTNLLECDQYKTDTANWYSDYSTGDKIITTSALDTFEYVPYEPSIFKTAIKMSFNNTTGTSTADLQFAQLFKAPLEKDVEYILSYKYYSPDISGTGCSLMLYGRDDKTQARGSTRIKCNVASYVSNDQQKVLKDVGCRENNVKYSFTLSESEAIYEYYLMCFYFRIAAGKQYDLYISDLMVYRADDSTKTNLLADDEFSTKLSNWRVTWGNCGNGSSSTHFNGQKAIAYVAYGSGDSNGDNELDIRDLVYIKEQTEASSKPFNPLADTDCNNAINRLDSENIRKRILGLFKFS